MAKSEESIERQHFRMRNVLSGELKEISIGPIPVTVRSMPALMRKACTEAGIPYGPNEKDWIIDKAWVGP